MSGWHRETCYAVRKDMNGAGSPRRHCGALVELVPLAFADGPLSPDSCTSAPSI